MPIMKRLLDFCLSVAALVAVAPFLILISVGIYLTMGCPIFFKQYRPGLRGRPFKIYKLCTMTNYCDADGCLLRDSERLTKLGRLLRATSLDELPELFNIIKGDMSIVGPRPLLMRYLDRYTPEQARRHDVKPGLTGWAQVNGRNALSWEEKFDMDVLYVDNWSLGFDLKIIGMTILSVLRREGISQEGQATMKEFLG